MISLEQFTALAHRTASRYSHRSEPEKVSYTFLPHTLEHFHHLLIQHLRQQATTHGVPADVDFECNFRFPCPACQKMIVGKVTRDQTHTTLDQ